MSISMREKEMDDWARDCVVRLANRVDNAKRVTDFCKWPANGRARPWMKGIGHRSWLRGFAPLSGSICIRFSDVGWKLA